MTGRQNAVKLANIHSVFRHVAQSYKLKWSIPSVKERVPYACGRGVRTCEGPIWRERKNTTMLHVAGHVWDPTTQFTLHRVNLSFLCVSSYCLSLTGSISDSPVRLIFAFSFLFLRTHPYNSIVVSIARFNSISY